MSRPLPLLIACAFLPAWAATPPADAKVVADAERAFAARAQQVDAREAFREHFAPDAISFAPLPGPAQPRLTASQPWGTNIQWRPVEAGISASGELGWTTGPTEYRDHPQGPRVGQGYYTSVWRKQPDGSWKVLLDLGVSVPELLDEPDFGGGPSARGGRRRAATALAELRALDATFGTPRAATGPAAWADGLHRAARWHTRGRVPVRGGTAVARALAGQAPQRWTAVGVGIAASGDLGYSYGSGAWLEAGGERGFVYLAVWQRQQQGWRLRMLAQNPLPPPQPE